MSHYSTIKTKFLDAKCLVAALKEVMGHPIEVEVHEQAQQLFDYHGKPTAYQMYGGDKAHVIVRRQYVGGAANDMGFRLGPDGCAFISDFDVSENFTNEKLKQVTQVYARNVVQKQFAGRRIEQETAPDGSIRLRVAI